MTRSESLRHKVRRGWRSISLPTRSAGRWGGAAATPTILLFVGTGFYRSFSDAVDILTGSASPFTTHAGVLGVLLALDGYLLVPAIVGLIVATSFARAVERGRTPDLESQVAALVNTQLGKRSESEDSE